MIKEAFLLGEENKYIILKGEFNVGRAKDSPSNIQINEPLNLFVSRRHCKIYNDEEKLEIMDIGSRNGTYVNGNRITPRKRVILINGDKLKLAGCELEVKIVEESNVLNKS